MSISPADLQRMIDAGVQAALVGTHFMRHPDPGVALQEFIAAAIERNTANNLFAL